ncbi:MAG: hypothetical protein ABSG02_10715 [Terriglobales bacterium]|jgi:hypothetical protein
MRWHGVSEFSKELRRRELTGLPTLEDANSIQVGLAEVMRHLVTHEIDHRTGALLLYAMQTASSNLKHTSFEPTPTQVVIDPECVGQRPIGATAWSAVAGREYDEITETVSDQTDGDAEEDDLDKNDYRLNPLTDEQKKRQDDFCRGIELDIEREKALKRQEAGKRQLQDESH